MMRILLTLLFLILPLTAREFLPQSVTFIGKSKFESITRKAIDGRWSQLPIGDRMAKIAMELEGIPYKAYTLEIHDKIESPSVNFQGLDCWTFFETVLGMARMLEKEKPSYTPSDLLAQIEHTRYRDGKCQGNYLDRLHYLIDWYRDNAKRRTITDITRKFPTSIAQNRCEEMTQLWKHYRYLKHNPDLRTGMAQHEKRLTAMKVEFIPKSKVKAIESQLRNGDIIGIVRHDNGSYCSHVGIIIRDSNKVARFMHASTTYKKVVVDKSISDYLQDFKKHAGIVIARPK
ncbi:Protein of unknown function [Rubritalea squalenifaciens DSM 18772]|uniref:DUF1460 domain-containing protein n=1 Tax=Rubritalea squalenifaciens DSM 18772 TaxID=1123071 RepID=A0A1M6R0Q5_9BACT|nr:N-acetylmuramoyl-L-alanine amidase-like domain-containing protein [Rubritalea squalenifaciens]SHK26071.1 Protein of unknown function [Rubritalea squalenifaciens DSM 18772]